jgi:hypothetical protein
VNWFTRYVLGSHLSKWLAWAMIISLALVGVALLTLVIWLFTPERDEEESGDESKKDYWRIHGSQKQDRILLGNEPYRRETVAHPKGIRPLSNFVYSNSISG